MEPITTAILAALESRGSKGIQREYDSLKATLAQKFGPRSELLQAVDRLEENPYSRARQAVLQESVERAGAAQDHDVRQAVAALVEQLNELPDMDIEIPEEDLADDTDWKDGSAGRDETASGSEPSGPGDGPPV